MLKLSKWAGAMWECTHALHPQIACPKRKGCRNHILLVHRDLASWIHARGKFYLCKRGSSPQSGDKINSVAPLPHPFLCWPPPTALSPFSYSTGTVLGWCHIATTEQVGNSCKKRFHTLFRTTALLLCKYIQLTNQIIWLSLTWLIWWMCPEWPYYVCLAIQLSLLVLPILWVASNFGRCKCTFLAATEHSVKADLVSQRTPDRDRPIFYLAFGFRCSCTGMRPSIMRL